MRVNRSTRPGPRYIGGILATLLLLCLPGSAQQEGVAPSQRLSALARLDPAYLEKVRADIATYAKQRQPVATRNGLKDWRCILHCHSYLSHDSQGTIAEIAEAARQNNIQAIFMTDHPNTNRDVITDGARGMVKDVLFVPGCETRGFLLYPGENRLPDTGGTEQELINRLQTSGGMVFVAHPEGHKDWSLTGLTGTEIYNTHADAEDDRELFRALQPRDAAGFVRFTAILKALRQYPREGFACFTDAPTANLERYDQLCKTRMVAAVAANDSHQNTGFVVKGTSEGKYQIMSLTGDTIAVVEATDTLRSLFGPPKPDTEVFRQVLDSYPVSLGYVSTHILVPERTEQALRTALQQGRTYVAFDWMADATGTTFSLTYDGKEYTLGDSIPFAPGMKLHAEVPLNARLRLMCDGKEIQSKKGRTVDAPLTQPGIYRLEVLLPVAGEQRPWIYTGAIRVLPMSGMP